MGIVVFDASIRDKKSFVPVNREHLWYDFDTQEMKVLKGGKLDFEYNFSTEELKVKTADLKVVGYTRSNDTENIKKWIKSNTTDYSLEIIEDIGTRITVAFEDGSLEKVKDSLWDTEFLYDIIETKVKAKVEIPKPKPQSQSVEGKKDNAQSKSS